MDIGGRNSHLGQLQILTAAVNGQARVFIAPERMGLQNPVLHCGRLWLLRQSALPSLPCPTVHACSSCSVLVGPQSILGLFVGWSGVWLQAGVYFPVEM